MLRVGLPSWDLGCLPRVVILIFEAVEKTFEHRGFGGRRDSLIQEDGIVSFGISGLSRLGEVGFTLDKADQKKGSVARSRVFENVPFGKKTEQSFLDRLEGPPSCRGKIGV